MLSRSTMLSRRNFLNSTLGAGVVFAASASQQGAAQGVAPPPRRMIVDAQVHIWLPDRSDRPWRPGARAQLPEPFTIEKLVRLMDDAGVERVVIVPPSWEGDRIDYATQAVNRHPTRFAIMGRVPLEQPQSAALLPKWKEQPGMLGIRVSFNGDLAKWLTDGTADWFWPAAEKAGIPVMFLAPNQLPAFARIAERHPKLTLIIDHMGLSLDIAKENRRAEGVAAAVALAKYPNVSVKLSAAPAYSYEAYPFRDMTPFIKSLYDAFGPQRCYWGTDMTNSFDKATYRQRITHFTEELPFLSEGDKDLIMGRAITAQLGWA